MNKLISTLKNIWSIKELRDRIIFTLGLLFVYRLGSYIVLPGIDPGVLEQAQANSSGGGLFGLINAFTGGAFNNAAIFALGIMPYISASIVVQLLGFAVPYFQRLQKQEGESGRRKINQITRWLTVAITLVQAGGYLTYINATFPGAISDAVPISIFWASNIIVLTAGTIFAMWLGERITDKGIGNGISLLITIGIIASLPGALITEFELRLGTGLMVFIIEIALLVVVIMATVLLVQGIRKIPIQYAKRMVARGNQRMIPATGSRDYIPLKVNASGVMPIIFAQAIMFVPPLIVPLFAGPEAITAGDSVLGQLNDFTSLPYNVIYFILVVVFTYVYTALLVNPQQYAEYLKRQNAFIPGIKPGKNTADFIDAVTSRITFPGSIFLGLISILPAFAAALGANVGFAMFFGGTSLLIMVGVALDTLQQIESHLLMRRYDGLTKSGRLKEKGGMMGIGASM